MAKQHDKSVITAVMSMKRDGFTQSMISKSVGISASAVAGIIARNRDDEPDKKLSAIQGKPVCVDGITYSSHSEASRATGKHRRSKPRPLSNKNWSEIKYAPKCGMEFLAFEDGEYIIASWSNTLQYWRGSYQKYECEYVEVSPTHWMPLPSPPTT